MPCIPCSCPWPADSIPCYQMASLCCILSVSGSWCAQIPALSVPTSWTWSPRSVYHASSIPNPANNRTGLMCTGKSVSTMLGRFIVYMYGHVCTGMTMSLHTCEYILLYACMCEQICWHVCLCVYRERCAFVYIAFITLCVMFHYIMMLMCVFACMCAPLVYECVYHYVCIW